MNDEDHLDRCVNRSGMRLMAMLDDQSHVQRALADGRQPEPGYRPELAAIYRRQAERASAIRIASLVRAGRWGLGTTDEPEPPFTLPRWPERRI